MKVAIAIAALMCSHPVLAQGTFQNLDFESANLTPIASGQPGVEVPITSALPGWSGDIGSSPVTQVFQNGFSTGAPGIDILGPYWSSPPQVIDGNYSVALQAGLIGGNIPSTASLWQDGTIPAGAESLQFRSLNFEGITPPLVSFAGDNLSLFLLPSGMYAANIAPYAGQSGQLEFTATFYNWMELDDISFSTHRRA
jgi:hypothetical protein